ncbi:MAG: penicillin-binding protein 1B [Gammaproteobacteria bacterium]|nr:penicillin-binding protein 1B [Gammaproteobacteria bacterium]
MNEPEDNDEESSSPVLSWLWFLLRHLAIWFSLALIAYWAWLDHDVVNRFSQRQWALPTRIFAAPLELYPGLKLDENRLGEQLSAIGYRQVESVNGSGQFSVGIHTITLQTRAFVFPDGNEPSRDVVLYFAPDGLRTIANRVGGTAVDLVRLDPLEIGRLHSESFEDRVPLELKEMPEFFEQGLFAVEDQRFASHIGIDFWGILRAIVANLRSGGIAQGASTLTQQLAKNLFLSRERSYVRKFKEALIAMSLERAFGKQEILEAYVNEVFLGQDGNRAIHGFGLGARFYFGRPLGELGVPEQALLIGLIRGPSQYNPFKHPDRALERRNVALSRFRDSGLINDEEYERFSKAPLSLREGAWRGSGRYAGFLDLVARQLKKDYQESDLQTAGLKVFTTLDVDMQRAAERAVENVITTIEKDRAKERGKLQAAFIVSGSRSGDIKALVGERSGAPGGFNRALDANRQIGSLMKPFVYLTALSDSAHFNVGTRLNDEARSWRGADGKLWSPQNYDKKFNGQVTLEYALSHSLNLATLDLGFQLGIPRVIKTLRQLGVTAPLSNYPALFLGAVEMTPYDVTQLYQVIANDGYRSPLRAIKAVVDAQGTPLQRYDIKVDRLLDAPSVWLTRYVMSKVVESGTARSLASALPRAMPLAGKTGTSDDGRDSWFAGFGGDTLAVAWIGRDDNLPIRLTGATGALRIWTEAMRLHGISPINMDPPPAIEWHRVTADGAATVDEDCANARLIPMNIEHLPPAASSCGDAAGAWQNLRSLWR